MLAWNGEGDREGDGSSRGWGKRRVEGKEEGGKRMERKRGRWGWGIEEEEVEGGGEEGGGGER